MTKAQKKTLIFILPLVIFLGMVMMFLGRLGKPTEIAVSTALHKPLPALNLPLLSDPSRMMTNVDLPKTPFLLNVWGSWCKTCYVEHPFLLELHNQGVPIIGVNYKDELADALNYLNTYKDPFVYSMQDATGSYALDLGLTGAPETFVVDGQGVVYQHILGEISQENWTIKIKPCLVALADSKLDERAKQEACQ